MRQARELLASGGGEASIPAQGRLDALCDRAGRGPMQRMAATASRGHAKAALRPPAGAAEEGGGAGSDCSNNALLAEAITDLTSVIEAER